MAPSWSRLLSTGSSSNSTPTRSSTDPQRLNNNKALPRPPAQVSFDTPPTLHHERLQASPPRPPGADVRQPSHGRSVSGPLPKIFSRKKSARDLVGAFHNTDVPINSDDLVPSLVEQTTPALGQAIPTRVISGKRGGKLVEDESNKITRNCMCCDSKLSVPKELDKFRCQVCLTINDLRPLAEQRDGKKEIERQAGAFPHGIRGPLSVERTRAIGDKCVITYLEGRCRRVEQQRIPLSPRTLEPEQSRKRSGEVITELRHLEKQSDVGDDAGKWLTDALLSTSPPDSPEAEEAPIVHSATIRDFRDIDPFSFMRTDTPTPEQSQSRSQGAAMPSTAISKTSLPSRPHRKPPPPPVNVANQSPSYSLQPHGSPVPNGLPSPRPQLSPKFTQAEIDARYRYDRIRRIFRPLEDYIVAALGDYQTLNTAFSTVRPIIQGRTRSESSIKTPPPEPAVVSQSSPFDGFSEMDPKTLLLGDLGENSSWWVGKLERMRSDKSVKRKKVGDSSRRPVSSKSPNINWAEVGKWYDSVQYAGQDWETRVDQLGIEQPELVKAQVEVASNAEEINEDLEEARQHTVRTLFKVIENVLKRPTRPLKEPEHMRFLMIILANPILYPSSRGPAPAVSNAPPSQPNRRPFGRIDVAPPASPKELPPRKPSVRKSGNQHTGILKRVLGLLANSSDSCHRYFIIWFSRFEHDQFEKIVELVASFVTHRITRRPDRPRSKSGLDDGGLIPDLSGSAANTSAQLHSALGLSGSMKKRGNEGDGEPEWANDWQLRAATKVMSLLFAANNIWQGTRRDARSTRADSVMKMASGSPQTGTARSGQLMHTSRFYNLMLDYHDMIADFKVWESRRDRFSFCQYPLFLSMGAKIKILEYDARRQMELKAREAYFDSVIRQRALDQYLHLRVRRECMVDDSLRQISEAVGQGSEELKKGLRVHFTGEEGVDAGGPRKEWFLMLVRDIFDPNHGMFVYDDESHACYFNPNSFETSDQYHLVGVLLGLAIYNSTILDVAFPPFAFRKLLAAAPNPPSNGNLSSLTGTKGQMTYTLSDLAEFRPLLAAGLQQLLDFDGDVEATYCRDFVASVERYGVTSSVPLIPNGEGTPVTNTNRQEFVDAYIRWLLDTSVARQFEPFKRGFFTVCAGNALSLFRAEEIELLVRGSDERLDVDSLRAVAVYENWKHVQPPHSLIPQPEENDIPALDWFWELFAEASPERQRALLAFITGSDRIPAVGATSLVLRIVAGGDGWGGGGEEERRRFPVARTCFNMIVLYRYDDRKAMEEKLWRAVEESEGFGLK
ncbi:putative E3 ubiquitin-protein ligase [Friedmanniomyces endolithicus]|nr:putative E3 ubiquitin-protein ligase [Friedmanniomyces endolithicus]